MRTVLIAVLLVVTGGISATASAQSPTVASVTLAQPAIYFGESVTGTVMLSGPAPADGLSVALRAMGSMVSSNLRIEPAEVRVAQGQTTATFQVTADPYDRWGLPQDQSVNQRRFAFSIVATATGTSVSQSASLAVEQLAFSIRVTEHNPQERKVGGVVTVLGGRAVLRDTPIMAYVSSRPGPHADYGSFPHVLPAGQTSLTVSSPYSIPASRMTVEAHFGAQTRRSWYAVVPVGIPPSILEFLQSLILASNPIFWGQSTTGTITLRFPAPSGGLTYQVESGPGVTVPPEVRFAGGQTSATFEVTTTAPGSGDLTRSIKVRSNYESNETQLSLETVKFTLSASPGVVGGSAPATLTASMGSVAAGGAAAGNRPAPANVVIALSTPDTGMLTLPAAITIPAGQRSASVQVAAAQAVATPRSITVSGTAGESTSSASLTLEPPKVSAIVVDPARTTGGTTVVGTVRLNGPAPTGGFPVTLQRMAAAAGAATVPSQVVVPAGATSATFNITTAAVTQETQVTVQSTAGSPVSAMLTLVSDTQGRTRAEAPAMQSMGRPMASLQTAGDLSGAAVMVSRPRARLAEPGALGRVEIASTFPDSKRASIHVSLGAKEDCDTGGQFATLRDQEARARTRTSLDLPAPGSLQPAQVALLKGTAPVFVCALVDADRRVTETDENNNCRCGRVP